MGHLHERGVEATPLAPERDDVVVPCGECCSQELVAQREQEPLRASHLLLPDFVLPLLALDGCLFGVEHLVPVEEVVGECVVLEAEDAPRHLDLTLPDPSRHLPPSGERGEEHSGVHTHGELASELHLGLPARFGANLVEPIKEGDGDLALRDARRHSRSDDAQPSDVGDVLIPSVKRRDQPLPGHPSHRVGEHSPLIPEVLGPSEPHREVSPLVPALHRKQEPLGFLHTRQPLALLRAPALVLLVGEVNPRVEGRLLVTTRELGERPRHDRPLTPHLDGDVAPLLEAGNHGALAHPGRRTPQQALQPDALHTHRPPPHERSEENLLRHGEQEPLRATNLTLPQPRVASLFFLPRSASGRQRLPVVKRVGHLAPEVPLQRAAHLGLRLDVLLRLVPPTVERDVKNPLANRPDVPLHRPRPALPVLPSIQPVQPLVERVGEGPARQLGEHAGHDESVASALVRHGRPPLERRRRQTRGESTDCAREQPRHPLLILEPPPPRAPGEPRPSLVPVELQSLAFVVHHALEARFSRLALLLRRHRRSDVLHLPGDKVRPVVEGSRQVSSQHSLRAARHRPSHPQQ